MEPQIIALSGAGFSMEPRNPLMDSYILSSVQRSNPKICFLPTASGDDVGYVERFYSAFNKMQCRPSHVELVNRDSPGAAAHLSDSDILYVGGYTRNMLAIWQRLGLDETLRQAWQNGTLLCGISAGAICWFEHGISDSVAESELRPLTCMGLLSGTACPHYNESGRREAYHRYLKSGDVTDGFGIDNGVGLHFVGSKLVRTVASSADVHGYRVSMRHGVATEAALTPTLLQ